MSPSPDPNPLFVTFVSFCKFFSLIRAAAARLAGGVHPRTAARFRVSKVLLKHSLPEIPAAAWPILPDSLHPLAAETLAAEVIHEAFGREQPYWSWPQGEAKVSRHLARPS